MQQQASRQKRNLKVDLGKCVQMYRAPFLYLPGAPNSLNPPLYILYTHTQYLLLLDTMRIVSLLLLFLITFYNTEMLQKKQGVIFVLTQPHLNAWVISSRVSVIVALPFFANESLENTSKQSLQSIRSSPNALQLKVKEGPTITSHYDVCWDMSLTFFFYKNQNNLRPRHTFLSWGSYFLL